MEKKDWREELKQHIFAECFKDQVDIQWYEDFMEQELDKAREEGYRQGQADKVKDMVFKSKGKIPEYDYIMLEQVVERLDKLLKE